MEKWAKWGLGLVGGGFALSSFLNVSRLSRFSKEFQLLTTVRVHAVTLQSLTLAVDIVFKNPTDARVTLKHPTVYLYDQDPSKVKPLPTPIQTSVVQGDQYAIKPNSETPIKPVYIKLSYFDSTFLGAAYTILKSYLGGQPITLWVRALSQVNKTIPITQVQSFTLNSKKKA